MLELQWYENSIHYLLPLAILIGIFPYCKLNLWERRKVIFTTIGIGMLIGTNELIMTYFQYSEYLHDLYDLLRPQATISALYGAVFSLFLYFKISKKHHIFVLPFIHLTASLIAIFFSLRNHEGTEYIIQFSPGSFSSDLFFLFWNGYTPLFPLNADLTCGFFTPYNWLYFAVFQVLFNTLYLLIAYSLAHKFYKYWHRNMVIEVEP